MWFQSDVTAFKFVSQGYFQIIFYIILHQMELELTLALFLVSILIRGIQILNQRYWKLVHLFLSSNIWTTDVSRLKMIFSNSLKKIHEQNKNQMDTVTYNWFIYFLLLSSNTHVLKIISFNLLHIIHTLVFVYWRLQK